MIFEYYLLLSEYAIPKTPYSLSVGAGAIDITDIPSIRGNMSMSACLKISSADTVTSGTIFANDLGSTRCVNWMLNSVTKVMSVVINNTTYTSSAISTTIADGLWHRYAVVINSTIQFYFDGTLVSTTAANIASSLALTCPTGAVYAGGRASSSILEGELDGLTVYSYPLTSTNVAAIACRGTSMLCPVEYSSITQPVIVRAADRRLTSIVASTVANGTANYTFGASASGGTLWALSSCR